MDRTREINIYHKRLKTDSQRLAVLVLSEFLFTVQ